MNNPIITGTQVSYYIVCQRKLWFFSKNISMEHTSELVEIGRIIHEESYSRKKKEITFEGIRIDIYEAKKGILHEVKKSKSLEDAHVWQVKYYLYYFKEMGIHIEGMIDYPKIKRRERVILTEEDILQLKKILSNIQKIIEKNTPPPIEATSYCKKCSYYEFCYC